jgi:putative ABC transport system ATP-binding protein
MNRAAYLLECVQLGRTLAGDPPARLLAGVDARVAAGEVMAVVGPSGAGKSTFLRLLNRLDEPTEGSVRLDGQDHRSLRPGELRRRVGMVMQRAFLFAGTVADNVAFGPAQDGVVCEAAAIAELLAQVGLEGYEERNALTLSGGEAQRVAITRALANQPQVLLLDEPTSALDEASKLGIEKLLESLIRSRRLTCVWVTHDVAQAARMADTVLRLEAGRMTAFGAVKDVLGA